MDEETLRTPGALTFAEKVQAKGEALEMGRFQANVILIEAVFNRFTLRKDPGIVTAGVENNGRSSFIVVRVAIGFDCRFGRGALFGAFRIGSVIIAGFAFRVPAL